jgi:hypothetical protein
VSSKKFPEGHYHFQGDDRDYKFFAKEVFYIVLFIIIAVINMNMKREAADQLSKESDFWEKPENLERKLLEHIDNALRFTDSDSDLRNIIRCLDKIEVY